MAMVKLSRVWLFGTARMRDELPYDEAVNECMHTHPDGRLLDEPVMSEAEAREMLQRGEFPDTVWQRLTKREPDNGDSPDLQALSTLGAGSALGDLS